jgi:error-prone DNA polymerase
MEKVSVKLRAAMARKGVAPDVIEKIIHSITSFALYGFPESHAISFAILAYGSAYLKVHRAPEFYASLLNNQPMGFYSPATIVKDARRHGVKMLPVCVRESEWRCTVVSLPSLPRSARASLKARPRSLRELRCGPRRERGADEPSVITGEAVRLGFCVVKGLRQEHGEEIVRQREARAFRSLEDFKRRVSCLTKEELRILAEAGALNCFAEHRRAALWEVEETLHDDLLGIAREGDVPRTGSRSLRRGLLPQAQGTSSGVQSPLTPMTLPERVQADYETMSLTTGPHPMKLLREQLPNIWRASDLPQARHGSIIQIAGNVICRQRPGTAKGFVFVSLEDETGVANAIVAPDLFERFRLTITEEPFLVIEGQVQNTDNVILVKARTIQPLDHAQIGASASHDFR